MFKHLWFKLALAAALFSTVLMIGALFYLHGRNAGTPDMPGQQSYEKQEGERPAANDASADDTRWETYGENKDAGAGAEPPEPEVEGTPVASRVVLELFFACREALERGSPGEYGYVRPIRRTLPYQPGVLRLALQELIRGPLPGEGGVVRTMPESTAILNLELRDGVAVVDFSSAVTRDSSGGSLGGIVFIQSVVYTATQFPTVEAITVLVEGHPWSDGHFIWSEPLGREDLNIITGR